ncbi:MAG: hypothetical protein P4L91_21370 [Burkholderiaceae bacterium]|nr:hypothetical protein [Burkholderiaceae bacterium]
MIVTLIFGAMFSAGAWSQTTTFKGSYDGASIFGGACKTSFDFSGAEPAASGAYPVFVYMVGTVESFDNAAALAAVNRMAAKGYVSATVEYASATFGSCPVIESKTNCIYNSSDTSAISQLCARDKADCSKGIVVGGFSQGAIIAILAKNYNPNVLAAYGMGVSNRYSNFDLSKCVSDGKRDLASSNLRAVDGEDDQFAGSASGWGKAKHAMVQASLTNVLAVKCAADAYDCLTDNGSGWLIVQTSQKEQGSADHCYTRLRGCASNQRTVDAAWSSGDASWQLNANLEWLAGFTKK